MSGRGRPQRRGADGPPDRRRSRSRSPIEWRPGPNGHGGQCGLHQRDWRDEDSGARRETPSTLGDCPAVPATIRTETETGEVTSSTVTSAGQKRIMLWAIPRSVSTAMCRVMMNSGKSTQILFELYGDSFYFGDHRGSSRYVDVPLNPKLSFSETKKRLEMPYSDKELVFAKDMPYYMAPNKLTADWIPEGYTHAIITRHPRRTVLSFMDVIRHKNLAAWQHFDPVESGYREQVAMLRLLQKEGHRVAVLDSDDLLDNPEGMLRLFCREVGLDFSDSMIHWQPLSEEEFHETFCATFEPEWFLTMKNSQKLSRKPRKSAEEIERDVSKYDQETRDEMENVVEECMEYYQQLYDIRLKL